MGLLDRIIIEDLQIDDQSKHELLNTTRLSARFEIMPLFNGVVRIHSIQLFGFNIRINKQTPKSKPNYQFIIDAFKPKKKSNKPTHLDISINSIIMRRGLFSYDVFSERQTPQQFNASHIRLHNISATLAIKALRNDSLNFGIKRLAFDAESGLSIEKLTFKLKANTRHMHIENFELQLPHTQLQTEDIRLDYDSLGSFKHFANEVHFDVSTRRPSYITPHDISMYVKPLKNFKDRINLSLKVKGTINQFVLSQLMLDAGNKLQIQMNGSMRGTTNFKTAFFYAGLSKLSINKEGIQFINRNLSNKPAKTSGILNEIGDISYRGNISGYTSQFSLNGLLHIAGGSLKTNVSLGHHQTTYNIKGLLVGTNLDIAKLTDDKKWGKSDFNIKVNAAIDSQRRFPTAVVKGLISSFEYNKYCYKNISLDGLYQNGGFDGKAKLDDPNGKIYLNGKLNIAKKVPDINLFASLKNFKPNNLNLTNKYKNSEFSVSVKANLNGTSIDKMVGKVSIDSLSYVSPNKNYYLNALNINSSIKDKHQLLTVESDILRAQIEGSFRYNNLASGIKRIINHYLPSLVHAPVGRRSNDNYSFQAEILNTDFLPAFFDIPVQINTLSRISGKVDERTNKIHFEGFIPNVTYKNKEYQSGYLLCENPTDSLHTIVSFNAMNKKSATSYKVDAFVHNDSLSSKMSWGNNSAETYSGDILAVTRFLKSEKQNKFKIFSRIKQSNVIVNDTIWQVHPSTVMVDNGIVEVSDFSFSHKDRFIHINGRASNKSSDTLKVDMKDINLGYIFKILNFYDVDFKSEISGRVNICNTMQKPRINSVLNVRDLTFNNGPLGDGVIEARWDEEKQGVSLNAHLSEPNLSKTHVTGYIYPLHPKDGLDLNIEADNTNLKMVHYFISSIFDDLKGRATGNIHLYGKFSELNLKADVLTDVSCKIGFLNTSIVLKDSLHVTPTSIAFKDSKIYDTEGNAGLANGLITFKHLHNFDYRISLGLKNMLLMNTKEREDLPFYGKIHATGNVILQGGTNKGLDITSAIRTDKNSTFVYINRNTSSALSNQFITFVDKTQKRYVDSLNVDETPDFSLDKISGDIRLNLQANVTPDATLKIIMDPVSGDYITARGSGNIRCDFYNKGNFRMFGTYTIKEGDYKFSLQQIIRKNFTIDDGSTITFSGAPLDANLNVLAKYTVNSASLTDLIPSASNIVKQTNIKVNCLMHLTGLLTHPTINFNLELPNEQDEIQTMVRNYISTEEQMNTQILYLLSIGKFYTQENTSNSATQNSNMMSSVLSSTISGQLNNILSQINLKNWNFGTNLSTGQNGWNEMDVEGMLSGRLLNNRLLVNGNFGYRDNPLTNSTFVGDFVAELLLNRKGTIRLKAYNETNDRYYTKTNLTTQGIGIILQKDFDKWSELFFWNRFKMKTLPQKNKRRNNPSKSENNTGAKDEETKDKINK